MRNIGRSAFGQIERVLRNVERSQCRKICEEEGDEAESIDSP